MFQIIATNAMGQFSREASQLVMANLSWEEAAKHLERSPDANINYALASLKHSGTYTFHNEDGKLCELINHKAL